MSRFHPRQNVPHPRDEETNRIAKAYFRDLGGVIDDERDSVTLTTRAGLLVLTLFDGWIAGQFQDKERARDLHLPGLNHFHGKWNLHFLDDHTVTERVQLMHSFYSQVCATPATMPIDVRDWLVRHDFTFRY